MADWIGKLGGIVGEEGVATPAGSPWEGIPPPPVISPRSAEEADAVLRCAGEEGLAVVPRGGGTKISWGMPPRKADIILSLDRMDRVVAFEPGDMTVTAQAGARIGPLFDLVEGEGVRIVLHPPLGEGATVGGVIATGSTGPIHRPIRELILGMQIAFPNGGLVRTGGRVVKNVAGFDIHKALVGSSGTLGVITEVTLRLHPRPSAAGGLTMTTTLREVGQALHALEESAARPAWTVIEKSPRPKVRPPRRPPVFLHMMFEGEEEAVSVHLVEAERVLREAGALPATPDDGQLRSGTLEGGVKNFVGYREAFLACRVGLPPSRVIGYLEEAAAFHALAHVESGLTHIAVPRHGPPGGGLRQVVESLRAGAEERGGTLVVDGPGLDGVDPWGPPPPAFFLMEALKREFDPESTLSPGRYLGGL